MPSAEPPSDQRPGTAPAESATPQAGGGAVVRRWAANRRYPILATCALLIVGMLTTTWGATLVGQQSWSLPHDLWRTLVAADRLRHLDFADLYTKPTLLVTFPGAAVVLVPIVVLIDATGLGLGFQTAQNPYPPAWFIAGPCEILLSATVLFAADAMAQRLGADRTGRAVLATAGAAALWSVSVRWGHPEDAVAVALLLSGVSALGQRRPSRAGWLVGAAISVQPLVLLGLPMVLVLVPRRRLVSFVLRAAIPAAVLLALALAANYPATYQAVTSQPNFPLSHSNHVTPWTSLAPQLGGGVVAAGPGRIVAVVLACAAAVVLARRRAGRSRAASLSPRALSETLWFVAGALALRCVFESVMVAYYLWPAIAVALVAAARASRPRLLLTAALVVLVTAAAEASWSGPWLWWSVMVLGLAAVLGAAWTPTVRSSGRRGGAPA